MQYLTATQAAKKIGVTDKTVRRWISEGKLKGHHVTKNRLAIAENDVERILEERSKYPSVDSHELIRHSEISIDDFNNSDSLSLYKRLIGSQPISSNSIRESNRLRTLNYLRQHGPATRVAIARDLGLSRATISSIIEDLIREGLVYEGVKIDATQRGGRRATKVHFSANAGYIIGIDIGRSHLTILLTDLEAATIKRLSGPFDMEHQGGKEGLEFVVKRLQELVEKSNIGWNQVQGIGIAIPGAPDHTLRMMISPPRLTDWENIDIPAYLRRKLELEGNIPIYMDNDANMGALGESRYGEGRGVANLIYIKVGTGIGAGLILNGELYRGSRGVAGEFGHILINEKSRPCSSCGKSGCLEASAGIRAIVEDARLGTSLPEDTRQKSKPALARYTDAIDIADVIREADKGDIASCAALEAAGRRIGMAIGSYLINVYNPSLILLDGGAIRVDERGAIRINELLFSSLSKSVKDFSLPATWMGTRVETSHLGNNAVALGAVATVIDTTFAALRNSNLAVVSKNA